MVWVQPYIGIDYDRPVSYLRLLMTALNLRPLGRVEIHLTKHGYHIMCWRENTPEENIALRLWLKDDPKRLAIDMEKVQHRVPMMIGVIFYTKGERKGNRWKSRSVEVYGEEYLLRLPGASKIPRAYYRGMRYTKRRRKRIWNRFFSSNFSLRSSSVP